MTAKRQHVRHVVPQRRASGGHDGQSAAEADAHQADAAGGRQPRQGGEPQGQLFDSIGECGRDVKLLKFRDFWRHDGDVGLRELACQRHQAWFVDAGRVQPGHQEHRLTGRAQRGVYAGPYRCVCDRHAHEPFGCSDGVEIGGAPGQSVQIRRTDDEGQAEDVRPRGEAGEQ